ncbi:carbohydrate-binding protein [Flammeovirgaceae bacterium 311]|nr:carbohydrate-binding protein [Flammeovirgaceae bacterium 311]
MNVAYIDTGDWIEYNLDVAEGQEFYVSLRIAGTQTGYMQLMLNERQLTQFTIPGTGGWQNIDQQISIPVGRHSLRFMVVKGGFNLNWLEVSTEKPGTVKV